MLLPPQCLLLSPEELLLQPFDFPLGLLVPLLEILLLAHRQQRLCVGIQGRLAPALHLLGVQPALPAITAQFSRVQASGLQHHRELIRSTPALRVLLACRNHLPLASPGLTPFVEGDRMNSQPSGDLHPALPIGRAHLTTHIRFTVSL